MRSGNPNEATCRSKLLSWLLFLCLSAATLVIAPDTVLAHEGDENRVVVHVTDEGFEPESVEARSGATVVFENVGREAHWPASDDHPTHERYPGFDPKRPIDPKAEWSFTFDEPGEWRYHDHLNPYLTGKIVVRDDGKSGGPTAPERGVFSSIKSFLLNAYETAVSALMAGDKTAGGAGVQKGENASDAGYGRIKDRFTALVNEENPRVALDQLRDEIETDEALLRSCHPLVHDIGNAAYEKYGDFGEAMKHQDEVCNSGYLHGVIESSFSESRDVFADMKTMCDRYALGGYSSWQCYHGIGHGAMFYTGNDLPRSLEMCDAFETPFGRSSCANGVFMENFNTDQKLHLSSFLKEDDPFYPCPQQADRHKRVCYLYAPTYYLSLHEADYAGALERCNGAEYGFRRACAYGVGMQAMKENLKDPALVERVCMEDESGQTAPCIEGMAGVYTSHHGSLGPTRELCARLQAPNRPACYDSVQSHSSLFEDQSSRRAR